MSGTSQKVKKEQEKKNKAQNGTQSVPGNAPIIKGDGRQAHSSSNQNSNTGKANVTKGGGQQTPSSSIQKSKAGKANVTKVGGQQQPSSSNRNSNAGKANVTKVGGQQPRSSSMAGKAPINKGGGEQHQSSSEADVSIVAFFGELLDVLHNLLEYNVQDYSAISLPPLTSSLKAEIASEEKVNTVHHKATEMAKLCIDRNSEAKYSSELLKELSDFSMETTESKRKELSKPPKKVLSTEGEIAYLKKHTFQDEENQHSKHFKHLDDNFANAINIFNKQIEADYTAQILKMMGEFSQTYDKSSVEKVLCDHPKLFFHTDEEHGKLTGPKSQGETEKSSHAMKMREPLDAVRKIFHQMEEKQHFESELQKARQKVKNSMQELENLRNQTQQLQSEVEALRLRLSEFASAKLTNNNPAITDLSDPDRPTKLAEKYSQLYDNQWTDSFAELAKTNPNASEGDLTGQLLNILTDGFNFCKEVRKNQEINLEHLMLNPAQSTKSGQSSNKDQVNEIFTKHLSEAAKVSGNVTGENIIKAFVSNEKIKKKHGKLMKLCGTYIEDCVKLCWLMQVQTPHVCIDLKTHAGQTFVKDTYREYTSSGTKIAFVVWPALLLYENGPLLIKGVAQGK